LIRPAHPTFTPFNLCPTSKERRSCLVAGQPTLTQTSSNSPLGSVSQSLLVCFSSAFHRSRFVQTNLTLNCWPNLASRSLETASHKPVTTYQLQKSYPNRTFDVYPLGLSSETVSGLSEDGHAGGRFPRPCLFERFDRLLSKVKPDVLIACYGMNDGIYQPLEASRFAAFQNGIQNMIAQAQQA